MFSWNWFIWFHKCFGLDFFLIFRPSMLVSCFKDFRYLDFIVHKYFISQTRWNHFRYNWLKKKIQSTNNHTYLKKNMLRKFLSQFSISTQFNVWVDLITCKKILQVGIRFHHCTTHATKFLPAVYDFSSFLMSKYMQ